MNDVQTSKRHLERFDAMTTEQLLTRVESSKYQMYMDPLILALAARLRNIYSRTEHCCPE